MWIMVFLAEGILMALAAVSAAEEWRGSSVSWKRIWRSRPLWAAAAGIFLVLCTAYYGARIAPVIFQFLSLIAIYLILTPVDLKTKRIPDFVLICMGTGQLIYSLALSHGESLLYGLAGGAAVWAICTLLSIATKGGFGLGDAKLLGLTAVFTGAGYLMQIVFWGLICAFLYSVFLLANKKGTKKTELPFVPFLTCGILIQMVLQVI